MQWYYAKNREVRGPVDGEEFLRLCRDGLIAASDLVWNETFGSEWQPARAVPEYLAACQGEAGGGECAAVPGEIPPVSRSERGRTPNRELMADARAALQGQWGLGVGAGLLFYAVLFGVQLIPWLGGVVSLLVSGPLLLGFFALFLGILRRTSPGIGALFQGFNRFGSALGLYLLVALFSLLWSLLAVVPGSILAGIVLAGKFSIAALGRGGPAFEPDQIPYILGVGFALVLLPVIVVSTIVQLRYAMCYFILLDRPGEGVMSAIRGSIEIMSGRKWKLFCLYWRFFGWAVLCVFTCGLGYLWLLPYMMTSYARFYEDVRS